MAKQKDVTLSLILGDSEDFLVTVTDDATPTPNKIDLSKAVDGTVARPAIVRFAVKEDPADETNAEALVFKTSYYDDEIQFLAQAGATLGQCRLLLDKPDTEGADPSANADGTATSVAYRWDLEVTRQDVLRSGASGGTVALVAGSIVVTGTGTTLQKAKVGDVLQPLGVLNTKPVKITKVVSATSIEVEAAIFQNESGIAFEVRRGKHKTAAKGPFSLIQGTVAE